MKKLIAMLLCVVMVMGLAVTAYADTTYTLTIDKTTTGHTYDVYQIFVGDLSGGKLTNVKYGANYGTPGDAVPEDVLNGITDAEAFAKSAEVKNTPYKQNVASGAGKTEISGLPAGYYLVKETTTNVPVGETMTKYIVAVVKDTTVTVKSGTTSSEKKVKGDDTANENWQDSADHDIGDAVPFQLKATVASDYANYTNGYKLTFHDKQSAGLTFNKDSVKVYVDGTEITTGFIVTAPAADGDTFDVSFANLKEIPAVHAGSVITVEYTSTLNENAQIGSEGNSNTSHITYTNNPNDTQAGENGKTPDDTVIVFTYELDVNKVVEDGVDADGNKKFKPLEGAGFTLFKKVNGAWVQVGDEITDVTTFKFKGLGAGEYKLEETTTPAGYNTIAPIEFTITAVHSDGADPKLTKLKVTPEDSFKVVMTEDENATYTGVISTDVENKAGSTLPETGGMGTTLFYIVGSIMVVAAGVLLVTKKRMA